ncbi:uroporphyrinogen decarboxylase family protein [Geomesophilobacter sediminis]|uniref:Uroporphyrinogen decarboxylase family protein n=1 Tax=Geomesophilobacter sediminis TaxID=2798584 RepID=A0A8J7JES1_9BACT|nr:uroporphyrinogen decarboxylase family protein [Geomesophilobacter sediminis]MBJ6726233.1 uroporphyrinogen decarboxylase family protein [Geomesophilobacter sediminis]
MPASDIPQDTQTSLERVLSYLQGVNPQRVACFPLILNHAARVLGVPVGKYNRNGETMGKAHVAAFRRYGNDLVSIFSTTSTLAEAMGTTMEFFDEDAPQIAGQPIQEYDDIKKINVPDFRRDGRLPVYLDATELAVSEVGSEVVVGTILAGPFTTAAALRPLDFFVKDLYKNPEWVHQLLEICCQAGIAFIDQILARRALPIIVEPIGSGSLVSPRHFKTFVAPYLKRMAAHIHENGGGLPAALHICGKTKPNLEAMLGADFDLWSLDAVDLGEARQIAGERVTLIGNVSPANLLKNSPEEIDAEAREVCAKAMGNPRGFILGSGCEVPINTPPANIDALINAARKYGRFDG